jgi:carbon starvation protein
MKNAAESIVWVVVAILGAIAFAVIALARGETINAAWVVIAGVCSYVIAYRFYARFIAHRVMGLDPRRATPAERLDKRPDIVPTPRWVL